MRLKGLLYTLIPLALLLSLVFALGSCKKAPTMEAIVQDGVSDYTIIYGNDNNKGGTYAYAINQALGVKLTFKTDAETETKKEILLGDTNRQLSSDIKSHALSGALSDSYVWGFAYRDGQFAFYFNNQIAFEQGLAEFKEKFVKGSTLTVSSDTWYKNELTLADYTEEMNRKEEAEKAEAERLKAEQLKAREDAAKEALKQFKDEDFGATENWKNTYSMPTNVYNSPTSKITESHPRIFLTSDTLPKIKALLEDPEYANMKAALFNRADSSGFTGIMPTTYAQDGESSRYSQTVLAQIESRAMAYLLTGEKAYGYEAIMGIKNAMLTLKYTLNNHMDVYHGPSHVMFILAEVYDWCYDLLTEQDKAQLISGCVYLLIEADHLTNEDFVLEKHYPSNVSYGLEFDFPPSNMNAVTGHGAGPQFLRDYMMVTISFADEVPSWWEYVGGRFFDEYLPVAELLYLNGNVSQGTSCYAPNRIFTNLIPAYLLKTATGENPYPDYLSKCSNFLLSHLMGNGRMFETGDGTRTGSGAEVVYAPFYLFAALYNDTFSLQAAKYYSGGFSAYTTDSIYTMGPALTLALCAVCDKATGNYPDDMPLITSTGYPVGQTTARNAWGDQGASVFMKINERTLSSHDLMDSGTFQIYYKGFLAVSAGTYDFNTTHHRNYLQSTVGMNGLLIYNPALASSQSGWYSGGQTRLPLASTLEDLNSSDYHVASVTGVENKLRSGKAHYAYLAGDLTESYNAATVDEVERRMLTVFTDDASYPMMFFVYDNITSDSADFKKSFLLHTVKEPTVAGTAVGNLGVSVTPDSEGKMTATIVNDGGKLVLTNVLGGDYMHKIGGEGYAYWIGNNNEFDGTAASGKNLTTDSGEDNADTVWGRIEVTAKGEKTTRMLNAMYVTDAENSKVLTVTGIETDAVAGAVISNVAAIFVKDSVRRVSPFSFDVSGEGKFNYYISGLYEGTWEVFVDDVPVTKVKISEDSGFLYFSALGGKVSLVPGSDILKEGYSVVTYDVGGGTLPSEAPRTYEEGVGLDLSNIIPTNTKGRFGGWYLDKGYTTPVTRIDESTTGAVKLYARWYSEILNADFSSGKINLNIQESNGSGGGLTFRGSSKPGSSFVTKTDGGESYLEWVKGSSDSDIIATSGSLNYSTLVGETKVISMTYDIEGVDGRPVICILSKFMVASAEGGGEASIFSINKSGDVMLGGSSGTKIGSIKDGGRITVRIAVDFTNELFTAYDAEGNVIESIKFNLPDKAKGQGFSTVDEWRAAKLNQYLLYLQAMISDENAAIKIHKIAIDEGNIFAK